MRRYLAVLTLAFAVAALAGCQHSPTQVAPAEPPVLPVSKPLQREVTDYVDFTGRTDAVEAVDIRPRVTGYLMRMPFKEGSEVKKGDLLFEIDPRPYEAQLAQAEAQVRLNDASLKVARITYGRDRAIDRSMIGSVSQQQLDQELGATDEASARLEAARATTRVFRLNVEFTRVTSPIDGMVSRYLFTRGNLVNQDQTLLTTVVSLDPMYVYFEMDEPTLLRIRKAVRSGAIKPSPYRQLPVLMSLQGEDDFQNRGSVNFLNNQLNPATGSITVRAVFPNPRPAAGPRLLSPGMFVRVRLPIGRPYQAVLVIDRAVGSDQGQKYVYVVDADNNIQYRRVTTGALQKDGLRVITQGLKPDDWVVVGGLQQVRPRTQIQPEPRDMPTLAPMPPAAVPVRQDTPPAAAGNARNPAAKPGKQ